MNVSINRDACIGCGICADLCSDTFEMGPDNKARVRQEPTPGEQTDCAVEAVGDCPTNAIVVHQD